MQVLTTFESLQVISSGTGATRFTSLPSRLVMIQADSGNTGRVQIVGVTFPAGVVTLGSAGISLGPGEFAPTIWAENLNDLGYITATSGDRINILVGR